MVFQHYTSSTQEVEVPKEERRNKEEKTERQNNLCSTFLQIWNLILIISNLLIYFKEIKRQIGHIEWQHKKTIS